MAIWGHLLGLSGLHIETDSARRRGKPRLFWNSESPKGAARVHVSDGDAHPRDGRVSRCRALSMTVARQTRNSPAQ